MISLSCPDNNMSQTEGSNEDIAASLAEAVAEVTRALRIVSSAVDRAEKELQQVRQILASLTVVVALADNLIHKPKRQ